MGKIWSTLLLNDSRRDLKMYDVRTVFSSSSFLFLNLPIRPLLVVVFEYQLIALGVWFGEDLGEYGLA